MQENSQSLGSQIDSNERNSRYLYKDSLEDSVGNKSQCMQGQRNTQNTQQSSSTLNLNDIVSGDQKLYQYEQEVLSKINERIQQGQSPLDMYINELQYQLGPEDILQILSSQMYGEQQNEQFQQYNQYYPRRRLFQQQSQLENHERQFGQQNQEAEDREQDQDDDVQLNQEMLNYQQYQDNEKNQYYDQDNYQNEEDEQNSIKQQQYYNNLKNEEENEFDGTGTITGKNVLQEYLQKLQDKGQIPQTLESDQRQEEEEEDQLFEDSIQQQDGVENLVTELFEGEDKHINHPDQNLNANMKSQGVQNQFNIPNQNQNTQVQNIQPEQVNQQQKQDNKQSKLKYSDNDYSLPVQMNPHLYNQNNHQARQTNQSIQQSYESKNKQIRDQNNSNQSNTSSNNYNQPTQLYSSQQSYIPHSENNKNTLNREINNNFYTQNSQPLNSQYFTKDIGYLTNSQNQNINNQNALSNTSQLRQSNNLQQPLIKTQIKDQDQKKIQQNQNLNLNSGQQQVNLFEQQEKYISQKSTPQEEQPKKSSQIQNEAYTESFQNKSDRVLEDCTYRSKDSIDQTNRNSIQNGSATQVAQKQLYLLNLLEQKEQLNTDRFNMLIQNDEIKNLELESNRTDIRINSDDYRQLKQLLSDRSSFSKQQQNNPQNMKFEENLQDQQTTNQKQSSSLQSQLTPENKQKQLSSITGNNTKELFEYSNSSAKNMTNQLYDSQPRAVNDYYESTIKNRLKVDLFKKLTDPQLVETQNKSLLNNSKQDINKRENQKDLQNDVKQLSVDQEICFYSEISPIDKGSRQNRENVNQNTLNDEQNKRQSNTYLYNPNSNQITFQNNYQFQSNSNFRESIDDENSQNTPTNQSKKQSYNQQSYENYDQSQNQQNYPNQSRESNNIDSYEDIEQLKQKQSKQQQNQLQSQHQKAQIPKFEKQDQLGYELKKQNNLQQGQKLQQNQYDLQQNQQNLYHSQQNQSQNQQKNDNNMTKNVFQRYIQNKKQNQDSSFDEQNVLLGDQINNYDQVQQEYERQIQQYKQIDEMNYNEYNVAKVQRKIANYQPDFVQKLHEYQQMSDKKKKEQDDLQQMELQMYDSYYQSRSPPQRQPKENSFSQSHMLMQGINLRKVNQSIRNSIKNNMNNNKKGHNKSVSQNNSSFRYISHNNTQPLRDYSQFSPDKIYVNSNSFRNDQKIRNEMIMNNLNYSPSSEIDNLNSSSNENQYFSQNNNINRMNMKQQFADNLQPENSRVDDKQKYYQKENKSNSCSRCQTCKQQLPPTPNQTNKSYYQEQINQIKSNRTINSNSINSQMIPNRNSLENQQNQYLNMQMSDTTSPMSQIKSNSKSPIKLDSLNNSPIKHGSNINSPFYQSQMIPKRNKNFDFDHQKFNSNNRDYGYIPKKQSNHNKSYSSNLNMTAVSEYVFYLNARIQQGIGSSVSAIKYCERGLKEIKQEDLFMDRYLFKYAFTLRQIAQSECKKIQQFQQQRFYLNQMEEQLNYCEKNSSNLSNEISHIYKDYNSKFNLQIYRELVNVNQKLKDYQNTCKNIRIVQQILSQTQ